MKTINNKLRDGIFLSFFICVDEHRKLGCFGFKCLSKVGHVKNLTSVQNLLCATV